MTEEPVWDRVAEDLFRMRVPGGWLYRLLAWRREEDDRGNEFYVLVSESITFVPEKAE